MRKCLTPYFALVLAQGPADAPAPTAATFAAWREHLQPRAEELRWESIPWLPSFGDGLRAAGAAGRPLLLWAMNGHPLGCT